MQNPLTVTWSIDEECFPLAKWYVDRDLDLSLLIQDAVLYFYKHNANGTPYESTECLYADTMIKQYDLYHDYSCKTYLTREDSFYLYDKDDYTLHLAAMYDACKDYFLDLIRKHDIPLYRFIKCEVIKATDTTVVMRIPL